MVELALNRLDMHDVNAVLQASGEGVLLWRITFWLHINHHITFSKVIDSSEHP
tara:strand:- start:839 stop:997 length:159 start_codon:yes stop_codon:yes gene_type:complete